MSHVIMRSFNIVVNATNISMTELEFPKLGEDFKIQCTVGKLYHCISQLITSGKIRFE